jgi:hypothetical protein
VINHRLRVGLGAGGLAVAVALAPMGSAWAGSHKHHKKHHKAKAAATGVAACPSASSLSAAAATTYSSPTTEQAAEKGWVVCEYSSNGEPALQISLYTTGFPLREVSANSAGATTKINGIGNAASHFGTIVFVQRNSAPSFSVIDDSGNLTLSQTEAVAKAIVKG